MSSSYSKTRRAIKRAILECYECSRPAVRGGRCAKHYAMHITREYNRRSSNKHSNARRAAIVFRLLARYRTVAADIGRYIRVRIVCVSHSEELSVAAALHGSYKRVRSFLFRHRECNVEIHQEPSIRDSQN